MKDLFVYKVQKSQDFKKKNGSVVIIGGDI